MEIIIYTFAFLCLYIGLLYIALALFGYDVYTKKNQTLTTIIRWRKREQDIWQAPIFNQVLKIVAPLIPLPPETTAKLATDLVRADIPYTPQEYYAKAILSALAGVLVAIFAASFGTAILVIAGLLMAVWLFFKNYDQVGDALKGKFEELEGEIPTLIRSVKSSLESDPDVIRAFEKYERVASPAMVSELNTLINDMKSSSVEKALMKFDSRMNNTHVTRLCATLIEMERGIDSTMSLQYLAQDMTILSRQLIQRELDKRPGKMKRAILPAGVILVLMMFYMLIAAVIKSASTLF